MTAARRYARVLWAAAAPLLLVISVESAVVRPDLLGHAIHNPFWWLGLLLVCRRGDRAGFRAGDAA